MSGGRGSIWVVLTRLPDGGVQLSVRPPLIYLDHCAVRKISSDSAMRAHFRETFATRGTLMFSVMNMIEMAQNSGPSYGRVRDLLNDAGPCWLPSDPDPATAHERERRGILAPAAFLPPIELIVELFRASPAGTFDLGAALDRLHDNEFRSRAPELLHRSGRSEILTMLAANRRRHAAGEKLPPLRLPPRSIPWIEASLARLLVKDHKRITENDINDLFHAVVPLRYAIIVVLDKAWASYAKRLKLEDDTQIFAASERGLVGALDCMRNIDVSAHGRSCRRAADRSPGVAGSTIRAVARSDRKPLPSRRTAPLVYNARPLGRNGSTLASPSWTSTRARSCSVNWPRTR